MNTIRVMLIEDHALVRAGIRTLLQNVSGIEVVAEAGDGQEAMRMVEMHQPDVILVDIAIPGLNGLEVAARTTKQHPNTRVLMLSMHVNEEYIWQALHAGADGYLLKDADVFELELAVRAVARGESYLSPLVSKHLITDYVQRAEGGPHALERLTMRQREILQLIAEGRTTQQIAQVLNVGVKTVETHRMQLMERLDIHDIASLVRYAIRVGLISPNA